MTIGHIVVPLRPGSDGDATHVPSPGVHVQVNPPDLYLEKTAQQWMERRGEARPGAKYILERLPTGYTMWQRPRPGSKILDKYLFGHPEHKKFDSPNRFYPHFEHLMENEGSSIGCPCTVCGGSAGLLPSSSRHTSSIASSSRSATPKVSEHYSVYQQPANAMPTQAIIGRPKTTKPGLDTSRVDEEGTPDVYRNFINKLRRQKEIDEKIEEPLSPDWRAESEILPSLLQELHDNEQWKPRQGEILLFVRNLPDHLEIVQVNDTCKYQLYDKTHEEHLGPPCWEAGLVAQTPTKAGSFTLCEYQKKAEHVIYAGVRVEPLPDPNNPEYYDKHKYIPLRQTRPFFLWEELLEGIPQEEWHPTICNALTVISTISLIGKHRFRGTWPNASIYCKAMYIGSELLAVGDTIRLLPSSTSGIVKCCDIMVISSIRIKWTNLDCASSNDYDDSRPYNTSVWLFGTAYTNAQSRSDKQWSSDINANKQSFRAAAEYSSWYPLHPPTKELAIPHTRVMGRLYEQKAVKTFLDSDDHNVPDLDVGRIGLLKARSFSSQYDHRITKDKATWYWGDSRADCLTLQAINGLDVAKFDQLRDVKDMRKKIKILQIGIENPVTTGSNSRGTVEASGTRGLRGFMAPELAPTPRKLDISRTVSGSSSRASASSSQRGPQIGQKRNRDDVSNAEEDSDDAIRQSTVVVNETANGKKRQSVIQVIIDD